jgi:hypothetical protein
MSKLGYLSQRQGLSWRPELIPTTGSLPRPGGQQGQGAQASLGE